MVVFKLKEKFRPSGNRKIMWLKATTFYFFHISIFSMRVLSALVTVIESSTHSIGIKKGFT